MVLGRILDGVGSSHVRAAERNRRNVVLTGIPRSGTTLACHLLNRLPDTVALHEPMTIKSMKNLPSRNAACDAIEDFFHEMRRSIIEEGTAISKHADGTVPDNPFSNKPSGVLRESRVSQGWINVSKEISSEFLLCIKHNASFTALLGQLVERFSCFAMIRNPLSALASWNSVNAPVNRGRIPAGEMFDGDLAGHLEATTDKTARQIYLLSWFYARYKDILNPENVIRYEDVVSSHGRSLRAITSRAETLGTGLENKNKNALYDPESMRSSAEVLLDTDGAFWHFYSKDEVRALLKT